MWPLATKSASTEHILRDTPNAQTRSHSGQRNSASHEDATHAKAPHKHESGARCTRRLRDLFPLSNGVLLARVKKQSRSRDACHGAGTRSRYPAGHDVHTDDMVRGEGPPHRATPANDRLRIALSRDTCEARRLGADTIVTRLAPSGGDAQALLEGCSGSTFLDDSARAQE